LGENLVFNPSPAQSIVTGGFSVYDRGFQAIGAGTVASVTGTPSGTGEIALLTVALANNGNSFTIPAGWNFLFQRSTAWVYLYQVLGNANPVIVSANLNISDDWIMSLDFFKFGGFASVSISNVTVNAANQATINIGNASGLIVAGQQVIFSGVVNASFLNGQTVNVTTASATQMTCTIAAGHANYPSTADTGNVSVIMQQATNETSGAEFPTVSSVFNNNSRASDIFVMTSIAGGIFSGGGALGPYSDNNGNTYSSIFALNTLNSAHFTLNNAYSTPNKTGGNIVTVSITGGSQLTSAGWGAIELAGSASVPLYEPYDVVQFKGSMFVCLIETTNDAFQSPASWALIGPGVGYVDILTADYTAVATDSGRLLSMNSGSAHTITLPNPVPVPPAGLSEVGWMVFIQNIGAGTLTIARNGLTIDGAAANLTLGQNQGVLIFADANGNFETLHGMNSLVVPNVFTVTAPNGSGQVTIGLATQNANTFWGGPTSGGAATPAFRTIVNADLPITVPTVPPEFTLTGNVASPAGALTIGKAVEPANTFWRGPTSGPAAQPTFGGLVAADFPAGFVPLLSVSTVIITQATHSMSGIFLINGVRPPAGFYRISTDFFLQANPSATSLGISIGWNDGTAARTAANGTNGMPADMSTTALNMAEGDTCFYSDGLHDITWSMILT
jgi:hypothetical protein